MVSHLLDERKTAKLLGIAPNTLAQWRFSGKVDLPFIRMGRNIRYRVSDIENFLRRNTKNQSEV